MNLAESFYTVERGVGGDQRSFPPGKEELPSMGSVELTGSH